MNTKCGRGLFLGLFCVSALVVGNSLWADTIVQLNMNVQLQTANGPLNSLKIQLFDDQAPVTVANFLKYLDNGLYNGAIFHRNAKTLDKKPFVLQGGGFTVSYNEDFKVVASPIATYDPIKNEFSSTRSNIRGTIAMAKLGTSPDSATNQWFINLGDNSANLNNQNGGFTVFGQIIGDGMTLVDEIAKLPSTGEILYPPYPPVMAEAPVLDRNGVVNPIGFMSTGRLPSLTAVDWTATTSNDWGVATNWESGSIPNGAGIRVGFGNQASTKTVVDMKSVGQTVGNITYSPGTETTIQSTGKFSLTFDNSGKDSTIYLAGSHIISAPVVLKNDLEISGSGKLKMSGGITGDYGLTVLSTLNATSIAVDTLTIGSSPSSTSSMTTGGTANAVPEPSTVVLLAFGAVAGWVGLVFRRRSLAK